MKIDIAANALAETPRASATPAPADPQVKADTDAAATVVNKAAVKDAVKAANEAVRQVATNLKFETDDSTGAMVVRVIDSETQKVLRQMPSEEMLSLAKAMDRMRGLMIHLKV
jgi:flagellar protein FlaG